MLATFASKGFQVFGYDMDPNVRSILREGKPCTHEPRVQDLLIQNKSRIEIVESIEDAIATSDISFVIVPTPSNVDGDFDSSIAEKVLDEICKNIKDGMTHTVVISSTIMPGDMHNRFERVLDSFQSLNIREKLQLIYSPEFIALGNVVDNLEKPQFVLIGQNSKYGLEMSQGAKAVREVKECVTGGHAPIHVVTYESAEIAKISCNTFLTTKISYANLIAQVALKVPGADVCQIFEVLSSDARIGESFFRPGLGYGGPCLPRDNRALGQILNKLDITCEIPMATHNFNESHVSMMFDSIVSTLTNPLRRILFLGVAYKTGTASTMESHALRIALKFYSVNCEVIAHDHFVDFKASEYDFLKKGSNNLEPDLLENVSHIFVSHPSEEYYNYIKVFAGSEVQILDPWGRYNSIQK